MMMDRNLLQFAELAQKYFAFLEKQAFCCICNEPTFVRYEDALLFINIYHGRSSFEIGLELGRLGNEDDKKNPYSMSLLLGVADYATAKEYRDYAARTPDGVDRGLAKLAKLFQEYVSPSLQNTELFHALDKQRQSWIYDFALNVNLNQARQKLNVAWQAKDYEKVLTLLQPFRSALTPSELQKLEYAEKYLGRQ